MIEPSQQVGTEVLFENDVVRVWDFRLAPGEESSLHRHLYDYLFVYVTDDNELEVRVPGQSSNPVSTPDGYVTYVRVGSATDPALTHSLANVGDKPHRQILVELFAPREASGDGEMTTESTAAGVDTWADQRRAAGRSAS
jgi:hypothetical protein